MKRLSRRAEKNLNKNRLLGLMMIGFLIAGVILIGGSISGLAKTSTEEEVSYKYYTSVLVESGDSLWSIAQEYMTSEYSGIEDYIKEIRELNHMYDDRICSGDYLLVPYYSTELL